MEWRIPEDQMQEFRDLLGEIHKQHRYMIELLEVLVIISPGGGAAKLRAAKERVKEAIAEEESYATDSHP